jgi:glycosyltransferase involved in cell wall biosynthesis
MNFDISVVLTLHDEGRIVNRTLKALQRAISFAQAERKSVEVVAVMDKVTDSILREIVNEWESILEGILSIYEVDFGAVSLSRNYGISKSRGDFISILDGDDLYGEQWLLKAHEICSANPHCIAHPEVLFFFPTESFLTHCNDSKTAFLNLISSNQWLPAAMALRDIFIEVPYKKDTEEFAYQDWLWNCETAAHGYQHVLVPHTLMAIRQKPHGKSLWQKSHSRNRVVRDNSLFRKMFLMEYAALIDSNTKTNALHIPIYHIKKRIIPFEKAILDYIYTNHTLFYQLLLLFKRGLASKGKYIKSFFAHSNWESQELLELARIEPTLTDVKKPQMRIPNKELRIPSNINTSMAELVRAEKPLVYILDSIMKSYKVLNALHYMHAVKRPIFVISTGYKKRPSLDCLPQNSIHIDIGNTSLFYEERLQLMHRLLLESDPKFIHVFDSELAFEMFDRYSATFNDKNVVASFTFPSSSENSDAVGWELNQYPQLLDFFSRVSTNNNAFRNHLSELFGIRTAFFKYHRIPFTRLSFTQLYNCNEKYSFQNNESTKPRNRKRLLFLGNSKVSGTIDTALKIVDELYQQRVSIEVDFCDSEQTKFKLPFPFLRPQKKYRYFRHIGKSKSLSENGYDVIVQLSYSFWHSYLFIQAMGSGIPIIAVDRPELEGVVNNDRGWILEDRHNIEDMHKIIKDLVMHPQIIHEKGTASKKYIETHHSWEGFKKEVLRFYAINPTS